MRIPHLIAISCLALIIFMLQGCGRKGPLFMEAPKVATMVKPAETQTMAIPAQSQSVASPTLQNQPEPTK